MIIFARTRLDNAQRLAVQVAIPRPLTVESLAAAVEAFKKSVTEKEAILTNKGKDYKVPSAPAKAVKA